MIKNIKDIDEVLDLAWQLSMDESSASFPRMNSKEEVKAQVKRAIAGNNYNIIASYYENILNGICIYYWIDDEKYVQTTLFVIKENYKYAADEMINYIRSHLNDYALFIGFPANNLIANKYFMDNDFECIDSSIVTEMILHETAHKHFYHDKVREVTLESFDNYAEFHDKFAVPLEMYYNSRNLKKDIEYFKIFVYIQNEEIYGSIFVKCLKDVAEVFGLFVDCEFKNMDIESILIRHMISKLHDKYDSPKELLYFIEDSSVNELRSALDAGFKIKDKYRCYKQVFV